MAVMKKKPMPKHNGKLPALPSGKEEKAVIVGEVVQPLSDREAPIERVLNKSEIIQPVFNDAQLNILLNRTPKWAIKVRQGGGGQGYRYVPHGYVTDQLNKAFGFNWDLVIDNIEDGKMFTIQIVDYDKNGKKLEVPKRYVAVAGHITVRIMEWDTNTVIHTVTKYGFGSQEWLMAQEFGDALKGARSDLVKTCAFQMGIALDLYWDEKAEYEDFEQKEQIKEARRKAREIMEQMQSDDPTEPVLLLSRAMREFKMDAEAIAKVIDIDDPDDIMLLNPEAVREAWGKIKEYQEEQSAVSKAREAGKSKKK